MNTIRTYSNNSVLRLSEVVKLGSIRKAKKVFKKRHKRFTSKRFRVTTARHVEFKSRYFPSITHYNIYFTIK